MRDRDRDGGAESFEKFYDGTPVYGKDAKHPREKGHDRYKGGLLTGRMTGTLTTHQPLHVGTGQIVPPDFVGIESDVPLIKSFFMVDGRLTIPGSSLKGAVRSFVEAITDSCVHKKQKRTYVDHTMKECKFDSKKGTGRLCPACRIFGAMGYQGHTSFRDNPRIAGGETMLQMIPPQYKPKGDGRTRRHYPHELIDKRRPTWPLEVAPIGSQFSFHIDFNNLNTAELGLIGLALGQGERPVALKLGAGKSVGLGAVVFDTVTADAVATTDLYTAYNSDGAWAAVDMGGVVTAAYNEDGLLQKQALSKLEHNLGRDQFV